jgi:hypothetical protein
MTHISGLGSRLAPGGDQEWPPCGLSRERRIGPARLNRPSLSELKWSVDVELVERRRIVHGWTRLELARVARVDPKTLRDLLARSRRPTFGTPRQSALHSV